MNTRNRRRTWALLAALGIVLILLLGCATPTPTAPAPAAVAPAVAQPTNTAASAHRHAAATHGDARTAHRHAAATHRHARRRRTAPAVEAALPAEPQVVVFQATDGVPNEGIFFPAAKMGAPMVVLMHWAPGFACDWAAIAPWLQNRGVIWDCASKNGGPWLQPKWFPPLPEGASYNVFVFSFRGCGQDGCGKFDPFGWQADAFGAMTAAAALEGVDPTRVVSIGASIGADGALDGCVYLNDQQGATCQGALSLSPGSYLDLPYNDMVGALEEDAKPAWCLYSPEDAEAAVTCEAAEGEHYRKLSYPMVGHGMVLLMPGLDTMQQLLDFLALTVG